MVNKTAFAPILAAAHAYQVGAARDELATHFHVHKDLLRRAPNLLLVSSNGAGFDPVDLEIAHSLEGQRGTFVFVVPGESADGFEAALVADGYHVGRTALS